MEVKNVPEEPSGHICDLCGTVSPSVFCGQCNKRYFCGSCDNMYHTHPKRQMHNRQPLISIETDSPVRPPKKRSHLQTSSDITSSRDSFREIENLDTSGIPTPPPKRKHPVDTSVELTAISTSVSSLFETDIPPTAPPKRRSRVQTPIEILVTDENVTFPSEKLSDIANIPISPPNPPKRKSGRLSTDVKTSSCESISEVIKNKNKSDIFKIPPVPPPRRSHSQTSVDKGSTESLERKVAPVNSVPAPVPPKRQSQLQTPQSETSLPALDDDKEVLFSSEGYTVPIPPKRRSQMRTPDSVISLPNMPSQTEAIFSGDSSTLPIAPKRRSHLKTPDSVTSLPAFSDQKEAVFYRPNIPTPPPRKSIRTCSSVTSLPNFATEYTTAPTPLSKRSQLITADNLPDKERTSSTHSPTPPPRRKKRELELSNLSLQSATEHKKECLQSQAIDDVIKDEFTDRKEPILRERGILQSYENIVPPPRRSKLHSTSDLVLSKIPLEEKRATLPRSADYSQVVKRPISATLALHGEDLQDWGKVTSAPDVRNIDIWDKVKNSKTEFQGENIPFKVYTGKQTDQSISDETHQSKEAQLQSSHLTEIQQSETVSSQGHAHYPYSQAIFASIPSLASVYSTSCPQCYVNSWSNLTPATDWPTQKDEATVYQQSHIHGMKRSHSAIHDPSTAQTGYHPAGSGLYPYGTVIPHFCPHGHFSSHSYATDSSSQSSTCQRRPRKKRSSSRKKKSENEDRQKQSESGSESGEIDIHSFTSEELKVTSDIKQSTEDIQTKPEDTWICQHCTYINPPGNNICEICYKTSLCEEVSSIEQKPGMVEKTCIKSIRKEDKSLQTQNQKLKSEEHLVELMMSTDSYTMEKNSIKVDAAEQTSEILSDTANITSEMEKSKISKTSSQSGDQKDSSCQTSHESLGEFSSHENFEFGIHPQRAVMSDISPQTSPLLGRKGLRRPTPPPLGFSPIFGKSTQSGQSMFRTSVHSDLTVAGRNLLPHEPVHDSSGYGTTDSLYHSWSHPSLLSDNIGRGRDRSFSPRPLSPRIGESNKGESGLSASDGVQVGYAAQKPKSHWESDPGQLSRITEHIEQNRLLGESHNEELKKLIREAEQHGFSIEEVQVALEKCGRDDPLVWLEENWQGMIENVAALATDYNDDKYRMEIGIVSPNEARDALRMHRGDMRVAILECVNSRRSKIQELLARGNFNEDDIAEALTANQGNIELTYADLVKSTLQPFLYQSWENKQSTEEIQSSVEATIQSVTDDDKRKSPGLISKLHSRMKNIDKREKETTEDDKEILKISEKNDIIELKDIQESFHTEEIAIDENSIEEKIPIVKSNIILVQHEEMKQDDSSKSILTNEEKEKVISENKEIEDITSKTNSSEIDEPYSIEINKMKTVTLLGERSLIPAETTEDITSTSVLTTALQPSQSLSSITRPLTPSDIPAKKTSILQTSKSLSFEGNENKKLVLHTSRPLTPVIRSSKYDDDFSRAISSELLAEEMGDLFTSEDKLVHEKIEETFIIDESKEKIQEEFIKETLIKEKCQSLETIEKNHTSNSDEDFVDAPGVAQVEDITEYSSVKYGDYGFASPAAQLYASLIQSTEVSSPKKKKQKDATFQKGEKTEKSKCLSSVTPAPSLKWVSPGRTILSEDKWSVKSNLIHTHGLIEEKQINSQLSDQNIFKEQTLAATTFHNGRLLSEKFDQFDSNGNKILSSDNESLTSDAYTDAFEEPTSPRSFKSFSDSESLASDAYVDAVELSSPPPHHECKSDTESLLSETYTDAFEESSSPTEFKTPPMTDVELDTDKQEKLKTSTLSNELKLKEISETNSTELELELMEKSPTKYEEKLILPENVESWAVANLYESLMSDIVVEKKPTKHKTSKKTIKDVVEKKDTSLVKERIFQKEDNIIQKQNILKEEILPQKLTDEQYEMKNEKETEKSIQIKPKTLTEDTLKQKEIITISYEYKSEMPTLGESILEQKNVTKVNEITPKLSETIFETKNVSSSEILDISNVSLQKALTEEIPLKNQEEKLPSEKFIFHKENLKEKSLEQENIQHIQIQNSNLKEEKETVYEDQKRVTKHLIIDENIPSIPIAESLSIEESFTENISDAIKSQLPKDYDFPVQQIPILETNGEKVKAEKLHFSELQLKTTELRTIEPQLEQKLPPIYSETEMEKISFPGDKCFYELQEQSPEMDDRIIEKLESYESENLSEEELHFYDDYEYFVTEEKKQDLKYVKQELPTEFTDTFADVESSLKEIMEELEHEEEMVVTETFKKERIEDQMKEEIFVPSKGEVIERFPFVTIANEEKLISKDEVTTQSTGKFSFSKEEYIEEINKKFEDEILQKKEDDLYKKVKLEDKEIKVDDDDEKLSNTKYTKLIEISQQKPTSVCEEAFSNIGIQDTAYKETTPEDSEIIISKDKKFKADLSKDQISSKHQDDSKVILVKEKSYDLIEITESSKAETSDIEIYAEEKTTDKKKYEELKNIEFQMKQVEHQQIKCTELEEMKNIYEKEKLEEEIGKSCKIEALTSEEHIAEKAVIYGNKYITLEDTKALGIKAVELQEIEYPETEETIDIIKNERAEEQIAESFESIISASEHSIELKVPVYENKQAEIKDFKSSGMKAVQIYETETCEWEEVKSIVEKEKSIEYHAESSEAKIAAEEYVEEKAFIYEKPHIKLENIKELGIKAVELQEIEYSELEVVKDIPEKAKPKEYTAESSEVEMSASEEYTEFKVPSYEKKQVNLKNIKSLGMKAVKLQEIECVELEETEDIPEKEKSKECIAESSEAETFASEEYTEFKVPSYEKKKANLKNVKALGMKAVELQEIECIELEKTEDIPEKEKSKECIAESSEAETSASEEYTEFKVPSYEKKKANLKNVKALGMKAVELQEIECIELEKTEDIPEKEKSKECIAESSEAETSASEEYTEFKVPSYEKKKANLKNVKALGMKAVELQEIECIELEKTEDIPEKEKSKECIAESSEADVSASEEYTEFKVPSYEKKKANLKNVKALGMKAVELQEIECIELEKTEDIPGKEKSKECIAESSEAETSASEEYTEIKIFTYKQEQAKMENVKALKINAIQIQEPEKYTTESSETEISASEACIEVKPITDQEEHVKFQDDEMLKFKITEIEKTESLDQKDYEKEHMIETFKAKIAIDEEYLKEKANLLESKISSTVEIISDKLGSKEAESVKPILEAKIDIEEELKLKDISLTESNKLEEFKMPLDIPKPPRRKSKTEKKRTSKGELLWESSESLAISETSGETASIAESEESFNFFEYMKSFSSEKIDSKYKCENETSPLPVPPCRKSKTLERKPRKIENEDFIHQSKSTEALPTKEIEFNYFQYLKTKSEESQNEVPTRPRRKSKPDKNVTSSEISFEEDKIFEVKSLVPEKESKSHDKITVEATQLKQDISISTEHASSETKLDKNIKDIESMEIVEMEETEIKEFDEFQKEKANIEKTQKLQLDIKYKLNESKCENLELLPEKLAEKDEIKLQEESVLKKDEFVKIERNEQMQFEIIKEPSITTVENYQSTLPSSLNLEENKKDTLRKEVKCTALQNHSKMNITEQLYDVKSEQYEIKEESEIEDTFKELKSKDEKHEVPIVPKRKKVDINKDIKTDFIGKRVSTPLIENEIISEDLKDSLSKKHITSLDKSNDSDIAEKEKSKYKKFDSTDEIKEDKDLESHMQKEVKAEETILFRPKRKRELKDSQSIKTTDKYNRESEAKLKENQEEINERKNYPIRLQGHETLDVIILEQRDQTDIQQQIELKSKKETIPTTLKVQNIKDEEIIFPDKKQTQEKVQDILSQKLQEQKENEEKYLLTDKQKGEMELISFRSKHAKNEVLSSKTIEEQETVYETQEYKEKLLPKQTEEEIQTKLKQEEIVPKSIPETEEKVKEKSSPRSKEQMKDIQLKEKEVIPKPAEEIKEKAKEKSPPKSKEEGKKEKEITSKPVEEIKEKSPPKPKEEKKKDKEMTSKPKEEEKKQKEITPKPIEEIKEKSPLKPKEEEKKEKEITSKLVEEIKETVKEKSPPKPKEEGKKEKEITPKPVEKAKETVKEKSPLKPKEEEKKEKEITPKPVEEAKETVKEITPKPIEEIKEKSPPKPKEEAKKEKEITPKPVEKAKEIVKEKSPPKPKEEEKKEKEMISKPKEENKQKEITTKPIEEIKEKSPPKPKEEEKKEKEITPKPVEEIKEKSSPKPKEEEKKEKEITPKPVEEAKETVKEKTPPKPKEEEKKEKEMISKPKEEKKEKEITTKPIEEIKEKSPPKPKEEEKKQKEIIPKPIEEIKEKSPPKPKEEEKKQKEITPKPVEEAKETVKEKTPPKPKEEKKQKEITPKPIEEIKEKSPPKPKEKEKKQKEITPKPIEEIKETSPPKPKEEEKKEKEITPKPVEEAKETVKEKSPPKPKEEEKKEKEMISKPKEEKKEKEITPKPIEEIKEKSPPKPKEEAKKEKEITPKPVEEAKETVKEKSPPKPKEEEKKEKEMISKRKAEKKEKEITPKPIEEIKEKSPPKPKEEAKKEKEITPKPVEEAKETVKEKTPPKPKEEKKQKEITPKPIEEIKEKSPPKPKEEAKKEKEITPKPVEEAKETVKEKSPPKPKEEEKKEKEMISKPKEEKKEKEITPKPIEEIKEKSPPKPKEEAKKEKEITPKPVEEAKETVKEKSPPKPKEEEKKEKEIISKPKEEKKQKEITPKPIEEIKEKSPPKPKEEAKKEKEITPKPVEEAKETVKEKTPPKPKEEKKQKEITPKPIEEIKEKSPPKPKEEAKKEKEITPKPVEEAKETVKEKSPPKPKEEEKKEKEMISKPKEEKKEKEITPKPIEEIKEKSPPKPKEEAKKEKEITPKPVEEAKETVKEKFPPKPKEEKKQKEITPKPIEEIKEKSPPKPKEEAKKEKEITPKPVEEAKETVKEKSPPKPKEEEKKEKEMISKPKEEKKEKEITPKPIEEIKEKSPPKPKEEAKKEKEITPKPVEEAKETVKEKFPPKPKEEEKKEKEMVSKLVEEIKETVKEKSPPKTEEEKKQKEITPKPIEEIKEKSPPKPKEEEKKQKEITPKPIEEIKEKFPPKPKEEEKKEKEITPKPVEEAKETVKEKTPPKPEEEKKQKEITPKQLQEIKEKSLPKPKEEEKKEKVMVSKPVEEIKGTVKEKSPPKPKEIEKKEKEITPKLIEEIKEKSPPKPKEEEKKEMISKPKEEEKKQKEITPKSIEEIKEKSPPKLKEEEKKEKEITPKSIEEVKKIVKEKSPPKPKEKEKTQKEISPKSIEEIKEKSPPKSKEEEKKEKEMVSKLVEEIKETIKEKSPPKQKEIEKKEKEITPKPVEEIKDKVKEKSPPKPKEVEKKEKEIAPKLKEEEKKETEITPQSFEEFKEKVKEKSPSKPKEEEKEMVPKPLEKVKEKVKRKSPPKPKEKMKKDLSPPKIKEEDKEMKISSSNIEKKEMESEEITVTRNDIKEIDISLSELTKKVEEKIKEKPPTKLKEKEKISLKSKEMEDGKEVNKIIKSKEEVEVICEEKFQEDEAVSNKEFIKDGKVSKKKRKSSLKLKLNEKEEIIDTKLVTSSKMKDSLSMEEVISSSERNKIEKTVDIELPKHSITIRREISNIEKDSNLKSLDKISPNISLKSLSSCRDERFSSQSSIEYISSRSPSKTRESFHEEIVPYGLPPRPKPRKKMRESITEIASVQPIQNRKFQLESSVNLKDSGNFALEQRLFTKRNQGEIKKKIIYSISPGRPTICYEPIYTCSFDQNFSARKSYDSPTKRMKEPYISPTRREIKSINIPSITTDFKKQAEIHSKSSISYKTPSLEDISSYISRSYSPPKPLINIQKNLDYVNTSFVERSSCSKELSRPVSLRNLAKTEPRPSSPITTKKPITQTDDYLSVAERRAEIRRRRKQQAQMTLWNSLQDISLANDDITFTKLKKQEPCFTRSTSVRDITVEDERYISAFRRLKDIIIEPPAPPPRLLKEMRKEREIKVQYRSLRELCTENIPIPPPRTMRQINYKYIPQNYSLRNASEREISPYKIVRTSILQDSIRTSREILRQSSEAKKIYKIISSRGQNRKQEISEEIPKKQRSFQLRSYSIEDINKRGSLYLPVFQKTTKCKDDNSSSSVLNITDIMLRTHGRTEESRTKPSQIQKFRPFPSVSTIHAPFSKRDRSISPINRFKNINKISEEKITEISRSSPDFSVETVAKRHIFPIKRSNQKISSISKLKQIYDSNNLSNSKFNKISQSFPDISAETTIQNRYVSPVKKRENRSISPLARLKEICSSDDVSNKNFKEISQYSSYFSIEATIRSSFNSPIKTERRRKSISPMTKLKKICSSENIADEKEISRSSPDFAFETRDRCISPMKSRKARQSISPMQRMRHIYSSDEKTAKTSRSSSPTPLSSERSMQFKPILTKAISTNRQSRTRTRNRPSSSNEKKTFKIEKEDNEKLDKAAMISKLIEMEFNKEESGQAAQHCDTIYQAVKFLQQQCDLCENYFPANQMITMLYCSHKSCKECLRAYFLVEIQDRNVDDWLCPLCDKPDLSNENATRDYFNHLDIMLKNLVDPRIHELFQQKLRDNILMKNPDFHWCSQCSSGLIASPGIVKLECHDCKAVTCTRCHWLWDSGHEARSCVEFQALKTTKNFDDEEGLEFKLEMQGTQCPECRHRYRMAKGGCLQFYCNNCQNFFCSGCKKLYNKGKTCGISLQCYKVGWHAHHPRNCLFFFRDIELVNLQNLLRNNSFMFESKPPKGYIMKKWCCVKVQKYSPKGWHSDVCGKPVQEEYAGLCRIHYIEYLVGIINKHLLDPLAIMTIEDMKLMLRKARKPIPEKRKEEYEHRYRTKLLKIIWQELPLEKLEGS